MKKLSAKLIFKDFFNKGHLRTRKIKKNVAALAVIKGVSILLSLVRVPLLISYLNPEKYGVWLTIASIVMWVQHFDMGLGHGLRNKFAEALAKNEQDRAAHLVSTAYLSMTILMGGIFVLLIPIVYLLDWNTILNVRSIHIQELRWTVLLVLAMFNLRFILHLISVILKADQRPALSDAFLPASSALSLVLIFIMPFFVTDSFFWASAVISIPPVLVLLFGNLYFFARDYRAYIPRIFMARKKYLKDIYTLGIKFFFIQMIALVMFNSSNIILTYIVDPEEVTIFNIARQYYSLPLMFFMIILSPYWSAITDAYTKDEYLWIKTNMQRLKLVAMTFSMGVICMFLLSDMAFSFWLRDQVVIPKKLSMFFTVYTIMTLFLSPYTHFLNGVGKLHLALMVGPFKMLVFLPVAILLVQQFGAVGLVIALIVVNALPNIVFEITQYKKIITKTATGMWNR